MKLIILLGALAFVSAQHHQQPYYGPQHIPVIQNGVPVEPPAVQAARAAHLSAYTGAGAHAAPYAGAGNNQWNGNNQYNGNNNYDNPAPQQGKWTPPAYQTSHEAPRIGQDGQPLDTPEVQAAKANLQAAYGQQHAALGQAYSAAQSAGHYGGGHYRKRRSVGGYGYGGYGGYAGYAAHAVPQIGPNGVPVDTPEVQHAKAAHFAAVAEATSRAGAGAGAGGYDGGYDDGSYDGRYDDGAYDGRYDGGYGGGYGGSGGHAVWNGPIHIPVIGPQGVPVDTPAVQHARAAHLAAIHAEGARAGHGYGYGHY